jgi:hypothetical protein
MQPYQRHLSAVFQQHADALAAWEILAKQGVSTRQMRIDPSLPSLPLSAIAARSDRVFNNMLLLGGIGATTGILLASLAELALIATHAPLLSSGLTITTIALLGSGASLGMTLGAASGAMIRISPTTQMHGFYAWVHTLVGHRQMQLSVSTFSAAETAIVTKVMYPSANLFRNDRISRP